MDSSFKNLTFSENGSSNLEIRNKNCYQTNKCFFLENKKQKIENN